ncbi:alpha/beta hydrolase family protein [Paenibacillus arenilitoris]|uniref:Carboxylic ester hydrolase n=1 Tax=Paenibacillus arenilitoris TaxID=2772299 RepID=A0A927CPX4_9BACL|nr:hypothetical protein [Paenibacillus arenilitoris]MBD2871347.1 hypothetical protein [Paenibacillus arenilitoris]
MKTKRLARAALLFFSILLVLLAASLFYLLPKKLFREPSGPYSVGTTIRYAVDAARDEILSPQPGDKRELLLQIWYPAADNDLPRASYGTHMPETIAAMSDDLGVPSFLLRHLEDVRSYSALNAPMSGEESAYPVILFSHGFGLYGFQNTFQMEELASQGYIVAAIQHPYHSVLTVFEDGRTAAAPPNELPPFEQFMAMNDMLNGIWVKDAQFVLDELERLNRGGEDGLLSQRLDLAKVGMLGHSYGGAAAAQMLLLDPRVKAAVNLDGSLTGTGRIPATGFGKPYMQLSTEQAPQDGDSFSEAPLQDAGFPQEEIERHQAFLQTYADNQRNALRNGGYHVRLKGASHYTFTDIVLYSPIVPFVLKDKIDAKAAHDAINEYTLAFFDHALRGIGSPLPDRPSTDAAEVAVNGDA